MKKIDSIKKIDLASYSGDEGIVRQLISGNFYNDYNDALRNSEADIVYVSTINSDHYQWIKNALNNNFHVIVDKPAFLNKENALELLSLAKEKGKCLAEAIVYQYHHQLDTINKLFANNQIKPKNVSAHFSFPDFTEGNFRNDLKLGGGAINDLGPYSLSIARFIFGENPQHMSVISDKYHFNLQGMVDKSFTLMMQFSDSRTFIGYFGFGTSYINSVLVLGKGLNVRSDRIFTTVPDLAVTLHICKDNIDMELIIEPVDSFQLFIENILNTIVNNDFNYHYREVENNADLLDKLINYGN